MAVLIVLLLLKPVGFEQCVRGMLEGGNGVSCWGRRAGAKGEREGEEREGGREGGTRK